MRTIWLKVTARRSCQHWLDVWCTWLLQHQPFVTQHLKVSMALRASAAWQAFCAIKISHVHASSHRVQCSACQQDLQCIWVKQKAHSSNRHKTWALGSTRFVLFKQYNQYIQTTPFKHPVKNSSHRHQWLKCPLVYNNYQCISKSKSDKAQ